MKVRTATLSFIAVLILLNSDAAQSQGGSVAFAEGRLWLSPVVTGDCVAARINAKRNVFVDETDRKYCTNIHHDKAAVRRCIEDARTIHSEFPFFTDRCSDEYFIGINGEEFRLRKVSKKPGKPHYFIGSFAGEGVSVEVSQPRLIKKTYFPDEPRGEDSVDNASYKVLVTVRHGVLKKTFRSILRYGR